MNKQYHITLLGGSNSVIKTGLSQGLCHFGNVVLHNFALGATTSIQNLYELKREKNKKDICFSDLVITESNINDIGQFSNPYEKIPLHVVFRNLELLYYELHVLKKPVLNIILPYSPNSSYKIINNIHKYLSNKYSINVIDMQMYYEKHDLVSFGNLFDGGVHQMSSIMRELGKNIVVNIENFAKPEVLRQLDIDIRICNYNDMMIKFDKSYFVEIKNSMYNEKAYKIQNNSKIYFKDFLYGYHLIALHVWNNENKNVDFQRERFFIAQMLLSNRKINILKEFNLSNQVLELHHQFLIDQNSVLSLYHNTIANCLVENYTHALSYDKNAKIINYINLISCICVKNIDVIDINLEYIYNDNLKINNKLCFDNLIPPISVYKEIIDEYCLKLSLVKKSVFGAKQIIKNKLPYKLGQVMVTNSKSLLGYIKMPFMLFFITYKHNKEEKIYQEKIKKDPSSKLQPLEFYIDYKEALKEKECFTYKLGEEFI
ncbi:hypothetical protein FUY36_03120, partial [Campylobacter jejuni]|nr:hypothetical protein [Campylobacter jejuni]